MKPSRKGSGEIPLYLWFFILMALTVTALWLGIAAFFGEGYDFRLAESDVLAYKIKSCLSQHDFFHSDFNLEACGLDPGVLGEEHLIYLEHVDGRTFMHGVASYRETCFFDEARENINYPQCTRFVYTSSDLKITGIVGSAQRARVN